MNRRRILTIILVVLLAVTLLGAGGFVVWASAASQPMPEALAAMQSDELVRFQEKDGWLVFQPVKQGTDIALTTPKTGLIIYPGGKVDYRAYAPTARAIAAEGNLVVVPPMPLNLAFFDVNAAERIMAAYPGVEHWAVAGHSLGGVAASMYAGEHPDQIEGIGFWASYPSGNMSNYPGQVVSIAGTNDGLSTPAKIEESKMNLPASTEYVTIAGGNHAQFGYYGPQTGDNAAAISREQQQEQIVTAMVKLLGEIS